MAIYTYTRTLTNNVWNINNPNDVDAHGKSVPLVTRIQEAFPTDNIDMNISPTQAKVIFMRTLSANEADTLNTCVANHESANGTINGATFLRLVSPNGSIYLVSVDDAGVLTVAAE